MKKNFNKNITKMEPYYVSVVPENLKRMHANESPKPILDYDILMKNVDENLNFYPENKAIKLVELASKFYNVDKAKIIATNGSDEGIDLCIRTFCNPGEDTILVAEPTFSMYEQYAQAFGVKVEKIDLIEDKNCFIFGENEMISCAKKCNAKMIFIPNPLANIGELIDKNKLIKIAKSLPETLIVIDEAYIEFCGLQASILAELNNFENIIILRTFSKFFGLAGVRLGFIFTNFSDEILKIKSPYNVNMLTCQIGINVFENITTDIINKRQNEVLQKRKELEKWLQQLEEVETIFESNTNFVMVKLSCKATVFAAKLATQFNIKIKAISGKFENYCRISVM